MSPFAVSPFAVCPLALDTSIEVDAGVNPKISLPEVEVVPNNAAPIVENVAPVSNSSQGEYVTLYHGTSAYVADEMVTNQSVNIDRLASYQSSKSFDSGLYMSSQESTANYYSDLLFNGGQGGGPAIVQIDVPTASFNDFVNSSGISVETPVLIHLFLGRLKPLSR